MKNTMLTLEERSLSSMLKLAEELAEHVNSFGWSAIIAHTILDLLYLIARTSMSDADYVNLTSKERDYLKLHRGTHCFSSDIEMMFKDSVLLTALEDVLDSNSCLFAFLHGSLNRDCKSSLDNDYYYAYYAKLAYEKYYDSVCGVILLAELYDIHNIHRNILDNKFVKYFSASANCSWWSLVDELTEYTARDSATKRAVESPIMDELHVSIDTILAKVIYHLSFVESDDYLNQVPLTQYKPVKYKDSRMQAEEVLRLFERV